MRQQEMAATRRMLSEPARSEFNPKDFIPVEVHDKTVKGLREELEKAQNLAETIRREAVVREEKIRREAVEREDNLRRELSDPQDQLRRGTIDRESRGCHQLDDPVEKLD